MQLELQGLQVEILKLIQTIKSPTLDYIMQLVTMLGEVDFVILFCTIIFWCVNKKMGYRMVLSLLTADLLNCVFKYMFKTPRPIGQAGISSLRLETATGHSFPSAHTQNISSLWISIMAYAKKKWVYFLGSFLIIAVGFSRLYLGVHWPIDVIGAIIISLVWITIFNKIFDYFERTENKLVLLTFIIPALIGLVIYNNSIYWRLAGALFGTLIGYFIERKYIQHEITFNIITNLAKTCIGFGILLCIRFGLKTYLPDLLICEFIRYIIMCLWITVGAPFLFNKLFSENKEISKNKSLNETIEA